MERVKAKKARYKQEMATSRRKVPPRHGEPTSKIINGKTVHWCKYHKKWMAHTSRDCLLGRERQAARARVRDITGPEGAGVASTCTNCVEVRPAGRTALERVDHAGDRSGDTGAGPMGWTNVDRYTNHGNRQRTDDVRSQDASPDGFA